MGGHRMADREKLRVLDLVAHGVGAPCLAAAFLLYFFVTWAPSGFVKRDLMCGSLLLAGIGASMINIRSSPRVLRVAGAAAMTIGAVAALSVGLS